MSQRAPRDIIELVSGDVPGIASCQDTAALPRCLRPRLDARLHGARPTAAPLYREQLAQTYCYDEGTPAAVQQASVPCQDLEYRVCTLASSYCTDPSQPGPPDLIRSRTFHIRFLLAV